VGHVACIQNLVKKHEGKRPYRRHGHRWEDNIRIDLGKYGWKVWNTIIWFRIGTDGGLL